MKSPKLILVLILFGIALLVVAVTGMNLSNQVGTVSAPASPLSSWVTGLIGAGLLAAGLVLLQKGHRQARRLAPAPTPQSRALMGVALGCAALAIIAAILFGLYGR